MAKNKGGVRVKKLTSVWTKPLKANFKDLFKSLGKALVHGATLNWVEATKNTVDALSAVGIEKDPGQVAWILIHRSIIQAMFGLVGENLDLIRNSPSGLWNFREQGELSADDFDDLCKVLDQLIESNELVLSKTFFEHPSEVAAINGIQEPFSRWLIGVGLTQSQSEAIADRLPAYFVYALADEWRTHRETYDILSEAFNTPFTKSGERERAWIYYSAWLRRQVEEPLFSEVFSLKQVYIPIRGYYLQEKVIKKKEYLSDILALLNIGPSGKYRSSDTVLFQASAEVGKATNISEKRTDRVVIDLETALDTWVHDNDPQDAIRVISGGPGSGKSSFAKMFAARQAETQQRRVLFVPLHRFEPTDDLVKALKEFVDGEGILPHNPLDPQEGDPRLLIIFDGLDELSMQGKVGADIAQRFIQEVQRKVDRINSRQARLKVIITGRELSVQATASSFRRPQQILYLLPYCLAQPTDHSIRLELWQRWQMYSRDLRFSMKRSKKSAPVDVESEEISIAEIQDEIFTFQDVDLNGGKGAFYLDKDGLLAIDQRHLWWKAYGKASGRGYEQIPAVLNRDELREVTAQPLLNYLVALSFVYGRIDFSEESNINIIYDDLLKSVYQRVWANYQHPAIGDIQQEQYIRILEEIAVAALHGDGRTTTLRQIEKQCDSSGLKPLLEKFKDSAKESVSRLLLAFYFRQSERLAAYDETFEFTHKSFGEYLAARRIRGSLQSITQALERHAALYESGWNERDALTFWLKLCGPVAIDEYVFKFFENEVMLYDNTIVEKWQNTLSHLAEFILGQGMPAERLEPRPQFHEEVRQSRNAEAALLIAMSICARYTQKLSRLNWPTIATFSEWISRLRGQKTTYECDNLLNNYDYLDLRGCALILQDLLGASFLRSNLSDANLYEANLKAACLREAVLESSNLSLANLEGTDLISAVCEGTNFSKANMQEADLREANFRRAHLKEANLTRVDGFKVTFNDANLESANLTEAYLDGACFQNAKLAGAICKGAQLRGAIFRKANLQNVDFQGAYLDWVNFEGANLEGTNFRGAYIGRVYLEESTHILKNGLIVKREEGCSE